MRCSRVGSSLTATRSESPVPRLSKVIRRVNEANPLRNAARWGSSHCMSRWDTQPWE